MLRASSLGLSLPSPTIFALQQCRRLYGARSRWVRPRASIRSNSNIANSPAAHLFPSHSIRDPDAAENSTTVPIELPSQTLDSRIDTLYDVSFVSLEYVEKETDKYVSEGTTTRPTPAGQDKLLQTLDSSQGNSSLTEEGHDSGEVDLNHSEDLFLRPTQVAGSQAPSKHSVKPVHLSNTAQKRAEELAQKTHPQSTVHEEFAEVGAIHPSRELKIWQSIQTLGTTTSTDDAWDAYVFLVDTLDDDAQVRQNVISSIPFSHLHRFCRLLARNRPKTHQQFLRLLSVMTYIKHCGGDLKQHEYNALIDHAGKGWRKSRQEDVAHTMRVFNDLMRGRMPGVSDHVPEEYHALTGTGFKPDIYSVTSLISLAARAGDGATLRGLSNLMTKLDLQPTRVTHLATLRYYIDKDDLAGFRATLQKMRQQSLDIGIDGLNACILAYSQNNRVDVSMMIYRLLRHNKIPETYEGEGDINDIILRLGEEFIFVEPDLVLDEGTYTAVVQVLAYHGNFRGTIQVFIDFLSMSSETQDAPLHADSDDGIEPIKFEPTLGIYRAIFVGFCKHAVSPSDPAHGEESDWTYDNLLDIFDRFLDLPPDTYVSLSNLYIIMGAFAKATDGRLQSMRYAWVAIHDNFRTQQLKSTSDSRVIKLKRRLFPEDAG